LVYFCPNHTIRNKYYGNGNSNGIIEVTVFFGGNIADTIFSGLVSSSTSISCWLVVKGKNGNILISFLKQESKMPQYLKYGDPMSFS
jgi:hypothetical protein